MSVGTDSGELQKSIDELLERVSFDICERIRDFHLCKAHLYSQMIEDKRKQIQKIIADDKLSRIDSDIYRMTEEKKDYLVLRHKKKLSSLKGISSSSNNPAETNIRSTPFKNSTSADSNIPSNEWQQVTTKRKGKNKRRNEKRKEAFTKEQTKKDNSRTPDQQAHRTAPKVYSSHISHRQMRYATAPQMNKLSKKCKPVHSQNKKAIPPKDNKNRPSQLQQKNVTAPSTRKTYLEATKNGAVKMVNPTDLQETLENLTKVVNNLLTVTISNKRNG